MIVPWTGQSLLTTLAYWWRDCWVFTLVSLEIIGKLSFLYSFLPHKFIAKNFHAFLIQFFCSFSQYSYLAIWLFNFFTSKVASNLCSKHVIQQFLSLTVWFCCLVALRCLLADSFRELIAFLFPLFLSSFHLSHFMCIADEIFSQLKVCQAGLRFGCILLR